MQALYRLVGFDPTKYKLRTELLAGLTTFLTMSYILAVNPDILSTAGMDKGAVFTATALASAVGTLLIAFLAKLPFAQAPSMGINAFFAFTLVMGMGYSWQAGLAAVFVEGSSSSCSPPSTSVSRSYAVSRRISASLSRLVSASSSPSSG